MRRVTLPFEEVASVLRLIEAAQRAYKGSSRGSGRRSGLEFMSSLEREVYALHRELLEGAYQPGPFRHFWVCDRKPRFISAAPFRDRVVHHSLTSLMSPALERYADPHSYACRPGKGLHRALRYAQRLSQRHPWALRLDVEHYFETLPHAPLEALVARLFKGPRALALLSQFIRHAPLGCIPGRGLPIGNLTSQHLANLYLGPLDHALRRELKVGGYLRYMDDLTIFGGSKAELWAVERFISERLSALGLRLKPSATQLTPVTRGVPLLGFRVSPTHLRFDASRLRRYRRRRRTLDRQWLRGQEHDALRARSEALSAWASVGDTFTLRQRHAGRLALRALGDEQKG